MNDLRLVSGRRVEVPAHHPLLPGDPADLEEEIIGDLRAVLRRLGHGPIDLHPRHGS